MAKKPAKKGLRLNELQLQSLAVLWSLTEATTGEVHQALQENRVVAYTTVSGVLSRLQERGLVSHRKVGRKFLHRAAISEAQVRAALVGNLLTQTFQDDPVALVAHLLSTGSLSARDRRRIRALLKRQD